MTISWNKRRSDSTPRRIITHCSSLEGLSSCRSYSRPSMSRLLPSECLVSLRQCVRKYSFNRGQRTRSLEWIAQTRRGLRDLHSINTGSHSNYTNWGIYCTYFICSRINWLFIQRHWTMFKLTLTPRWPLTAMLSHFLHHPNLSFAASYCMSSIHLCSGICSIKTLFAFDYSCVFYSHPRLCWRTFLQIRYNWKGTCIPPHILTNSISLLEFINGPHEHLQTNHNSMFTTTIW